MPVEKRSPTSLAVVMAIMMTMEYDTSAVRDSWQGLVEQVEEQ